MSSSLDILGIRHHGPGSARAVVRALESVSPACVLIEAPADIPRDVIDLAADQAMQPPVALLIYETENPRESSFLPFSEFSPEWCAIRWALTSKIPLRFMDLPQSHRIPVTKNFAADQKTPEEQGSQAEQADEPPSNSNAPVDPDQVLRLDPLNELARAAGFDDGGEGGGAGGHDAPPPLPVGLQVIAGAWGEAAAVRVAHAFEVTAPFARRGWAPLAAK